MGGLMELIQKRIKIHETSFSDKGLSKAARLTFHLNFFAIFLLTFSRLPMLLYPEK